MWLSKIGSPTWARTTDQQINSLLLYRLSYWGINLAVLGGNDPHSYGVTSHRASMNTLRPNFYSQAPRDADLSTM